MSDCLGVIISLHVRVTCGMNVCGSECGIYKAQTYVRIYLHVGYTNIFPKESSEVQNDTLLSVRCHIDSHMCNSCGHPALHKSSHLKTQLLADHFHNIQILVESFFFIKR